MAKSRKGEDGQSVLEFALVLPILVLFLIGIIDFGRLYSAHLILTEAATDAARYASLGDTDTQVGQVVQTDAGMLGSGVNWQITPTGSRVSGDSVTVEVTDPVRLFDPILAAILGNPATAQSTVTMRVE